MSQHEDHGAATEPLANPGTTGRPVEPRVQETAQQVQPERTRHAARFGTILWGVVLLVFAAAMLTTTLTDVRIDPLGWITGGLIAAGAVLVIAGIAAAVRRRP